MRGRLGTFVVIVALCWALPRAAWGGRVFQWTDKGGSPHYTDNLWELPAPVRTRYLELIEEEARKKYTPQQIRDLKEAGDWPPAELIRPPTLKTDAPLTEWGGLKILGADADVHRAIADEFRFQWNSFYEERNRLEQQRRSLTEQVPPAEDALAVARRDDQIMGRIPAECLAPAAEKALAALRANLQSVMAAQAQLAAKERSLLLGQRAYGHPGEDGGPATFGPGSR